jgi:ABC-type spermidine/putrescine transport system permease subunit I
MVANLIDTSIRQLNRLDYAAGLAMIVAVVVLVTLPVALRQIAPPPES